MAPADDESAAEGEGEQGHALILVLTIVLTFVLYRLPHATTIAWPLVLLSTLAHESGHGIAAILAGGQFQSFLLNSDGSGLAHTRVEGRLAQAFVSAGGLVGPACVAALLFALARYPRLARASLIAIGTLLAIAVPLLLEGVYGTVFVAAVAVLLLLIGIKGSPRLSQHVSAFVAVQLALSAYSRGDYLFTDTCHLPTGDIPSDSANMGSALFGPYWFWGLVCGAFSIVVVVVGVILFLRGLPGFGRAPAKTVAAPGPVASESPSAALERMLAELKTKHGESSGRSPVTKEP